MHNTKSTQNKNYDLKKTISELLEHFLSGIHRKLKNVYTESRS